MEASPEAVTQLLHAVGRGEREAFDRLFPLVYGQLEGLARRALRREWKRGDRTLLTQGLVHEAYLRMVDQPQPEWEGRAHFFAIAGRVMRQIMVDYARRRGAAKRGGDWHRVTLSGADPGFEVQLEEILALDGALDRLEALEPRLRRVVECRFFAGMKEEEIGTALGVSLRTVQRDWLKARAWLHKELYPE